MHVSDRDFWAETGAVGQFELTNICYGERTIKSITMREIWCEIATGMRVCRDPILLITYDSRSRRGCVVFKALEAADVVPLRSLLSQGCTRLSLRMQRGKLPNDFVVVIDIDYGIRNFCQQI